MNGNLCEFWSLEIETLQKEFRGMLSLFQFDSEASKLIW